MNEDMKVLSFDADISPVEFILLMFDRTDLDGVLYIPAWFYDSPGGLEIYTPGTFDSKQSFRCNVDWNLSDLERVTKKFLHVYSTIEKIASYELEDCMVVANVKKILNDDVLFKVWDTYLRSWDYGDVDMTALTEICQKMALRAWVKAIALNVINGVQTKEYEKEALLKYMDVMVSTDEKQCYETYITMIQKDARQRAKDNVFAYSVIFRARRLWQMMRSNQTQQKIREEARVFAAAMVLNEYGTSREIVGNYMRLLLEKQELMTDEELDVMYHPKQANSRKSLAPLFIYRLLKENTNSEKHMRQQEIIAALKEYPYEICLERKAVGRTIQNLVDSQLGVYSDSTGTWAE